MKLAYSQDLKRIDALAAAKYRIPLARLMERAAGAALRVLRRKAGSFPGKKIGILSGKGHNGGDGLALARLLKKKGASVKVFLAAAPGDLSAETARQYQKAKAARVPLETMGKKLNPARAKAFFDSSDLLVDGLLGTGLSRAPRGLVKALIQKANRSGKPILALDVPSGFSADEGRPLGEAIRARWTVTFGLPKPGFYMPGAPSYTGEILLDKIGFPPALLQESFLSAELTDARMVKGFLPRYDGEVHKGTRGRVLVVAGSPGLTGAAALCAWGAQRIGAGLVTVACAKSIYPILAVKLTESMTAPLPETGGGFLSPKAEGKLLGLSQRMDSLVIGPGLGRNPKTARLLQKLLPRLRAPMVLDADALFLLAGKGSWLKRALAPALLTPHSGEAARLLGTTAEAVERRRLDIAKQIAREYNAVVVLKGPHTVIADPQGRVRINPTGNRGLATGGTGDVLSGILGGLLAQGLKPFDAAAAGVYLHGLAGEKASQMLGPDGLLAGDLLPILPGLLKRVR
ncbi:MAG TPA: NAD(P)H-hydrate dehydratase [bacterium]|nr:NAD(P)H-hydrate dehydratase [bacterium]